MDFAMSQGWDNDSNHFVWWKPQEWKRYRYVMKKTAPYCEVCPKTRLTDKEYGQNGFQCAVPKRWEKMKGRQPIGLSPRYDGGKAYDCHRERGSVAFGERQADKNG